MLNVLVTSNRSSCVNINRSHELRAVRKPDWMSASHASRMQTTESVRWHIRCSNRYQQHAEIYNRRMYTSRFRTANVVAVHYWRKCLAFSLFSVLLSLSLFFVYLRMFCHLPRLQLPILRVNSVDATKRRGSDLFMVFALHIRVQWYLRETTEYVCRNTESRFETRSKNWKIFRKKTELFVWLLFRVLIPITDCKTYNDTKINSDHIQQIINKSSHWSHRWYTDDLREI
jgi:hypothetical protein